MKKLFVLAALLLCSATAQGADFVYPDDVLDKITELKAMVEAKKEMPSSMGDIKMVDSAEAYALWKGKKAIFIDTRPKAQYDTEKIPDAIWLDADKLLDDPSLANSLDKNKEYVTYCSGVLCRRAPGGALQLKSMGFKNVKFYRAGLPEWKSKGYPVK
jgi:rhodanese-related sulfurtransferase